MLDQKITRVRPNDSAGAPQVLLGEFRMSVPTGAVTLAAAATATAGFLYTMRWTSATSKAIIRYINATWIMTTAFGTNQNMGLDLIMARSYTVSATGGTAIDCGSTVANTGTPRTSATSLFAANACRVATTTGLTAGTQTLDANSYVNMQKWMSVTLGNDGVLGASANFTLLDARDDGAGTYVRTPLTLAANEGFVLRNTILMGATGVGTWVFTVEWDEVTV